MTNPPINISSLNFEDIKSSLISYLKKQTYFNSYNFSDTALSTLVDVLAYNTMFYSYYANMIANETFISTAQIEDNLLSIIKPLGYVINGTNSSKAIITLTGDQVTVTAYSTIFTGTNPFNVPYNFYTTKDYTLNSVQPTEITLYEANSLITNKMINTPDEILTDKLDLETQTYYIGGLNIDINTLNVYVDEGDGNYISWTKYNQYDPKRNSESDRIFFIERQENGFNLLFSRPSVNEIFGFSGGKKILSSYKVKISYIIPTGSAGDNCIINSTSVGNIVAGGISTGGGKPDIDLIRSFAPKLFAASDRAVTKDDYYGVILNSNAVPVSITKPEQIIIWGGEELNKPLPGRVFYSFADLAITANTVKTLTNILKQKGMMTIIPEYIPAKQIKVSSTIRYSGPQTALQIQSDIFEYYNLSLEFNRIFSNTDILLYLASKYSLAPAVLDVTSTLLKFNLNRSDNIINLNNELNIPGSALSVGTSFYSDTFYNNGILLSIQDYQNTLVYYDVSARTIHTTDVGTINYNTGEIYIKPKYIPETGLSFTAVPRNSKIINSKLNNLLIIEPTVTKI